MNGQPPAQPPRREQRQLEPLHTLIAHLGRLLLHNWPYKLLSVLLSILLWAGLITQDPTLTREKSFQNVNVTISGSEAIKRNGFIVLSDLSALLKDVDLRVNVPQMQYQNAKAINYSVRVDLSRITQAGEQELIIQSTNSSVYGTVLEVEPASVTIEVDEYITRYRIPVRTQTKGVVGENFYASAPSVDSSVVAISGPKSIVDRIVCAEVLVDLATIPAREGTMRMALPFVLLDADNEVVESDLLEVTNQSVLLDSVVVSVDVYSAVRIPLADLGLLVGTPENGYEVKSVSVTPESVLVAGRASEMETLDLIYADGVVNVSGRTSSFNERVRLRQSPEMKYISATTCTVSVEIGPVMVSRTFDNIRLGIINVGKGLTAELGEKMASVTLTGPQLWMNALQSSDVELLCDATNLTEGTYELPVIVNIKNKGSMAYTVDITPEYIPVTVTSKE